MESKWLQKLPGWQKFMQERRLGANGAYLSDRCPVGSYCVLYTHFARPTLANAEITILCPSGTYVMPDGRTLDSDLRSTYHLEETSNRLSSIVEARQVLLSNSLG